MIRLAIQIKKLRKPFSRGNSRSKIIKNLSKTMAELELTITRTDQNFLPKLIAIEISKNVFTDKKVSKQAIQQILMTHIEMNTYKNT